MSDIVDKVTIARDSEEPDSLKATNLESWQRRSATSVQNPNRSGQEARLDEILRRAAQRDQEEEVAPQAPPSLALETESTHIPGPSTRGEESESVIRRMTFWHNGFSVDDGELMSYDDPENTRILQEIQAGNAPPRLLNVLPGQAVRLHVFRRLHEDYVPTPKARPAVMEQVPIDSVSRARAMAHKFIASFNS